MVASILFSAKKIHENTKRGDANYMIMSKSTVKSIYNPLADEIDRDILNTMMDAIE